MTSEIKTDETKTAPIDVPSDTPKELKSSEEAKNVVDDSKNESINKKADDAPVVEQEKAGDSSKPAEPTSSTTSDTTASLKPNKKNKKLLNPKDLIKTPNKHDVLLGRGKPVSLKLYRLRTRSNSLINICLRMFLLLFLLLVSEPRWKSGHAQNCRHVSQALS